MTVDRISTSKNFLLSIFLGVFLLAGLSSCEKRVTPNKVERIFQKDSWKITSFIFQDQNIEDNFNAVTFDFNETNGITALPANMYAGNWDMGLNKKPTILNIFNVFEPSYSALNDDWTVVTCGNSLITLESQNGPFLNTIVFRKIEL
jgi:hypothetical protein|tara:strand:- start:116310 stop:116750 length:441 start_codon:yes stop_codon:yes gene_type:complete